MKVLKKGNNLIAYDTNKEKLGTLNLLTGKFIGATKCWKQLLKKKEQYKVKAIKTSLLKHIYYEEN